MVLAVDGGGSKTDVVAITTDGELVGHARGAGSNPQVLGLPVAIGIAVALATWVPLVARPVLDGSYDWEALKARYWPGLTVETARESYEELRSRIPEMPKPPAMPGRPGTPGKPSGGSGR